MMKERQLTACDGGNLDSERRTARGEFHLQSFALLNTRQQYKKFLIGGVEVGGYDYRQ